jgi:transcriptional regulator with XRE-family HTH domain
MALRLERLRANLTQPELARLLGVSERAVRGWDIAEFCPNAESRRLIARHFPRLIDAWTYVEEELDEHTDRRPRPGPEGASTPP